MLSEEFLDFPGIKQLVRDYNLMKDSVKKLSTQAYILRPFKNQIIYKELETAKGFYGILEGEVSFFKRNYNVEEELIKIEFLKITENLEYQDKDLNNIDSEELIRRIRENIRLEIKKEIGALKKEEDQNNFNNNLKINSVLHKSSRNNLIYSGNNSVNSSANVDHNNTNIHALRALTNVKFLNNLHNKHDISNCKLNLKSNNKQKSNKVLGLIDNKESNTKEQTFISQRRYTNNGNINNKSSNSINNIAFDKGNDNIYSQNTKKSNLIGKRNSVLGNNKAKSKNNLNIVETHLHIGNRAQYEKLTDTKENHNEIFETIKSNIDITSSHDEDNENNSNVQIMSIPISKRNRKSHINSYLNININEDKSNNNPLYVGNTNKENSNDNDYIHVNNKLSVNKLGIKYDRNTKSSYIDNFVNILYKGRIFGEIELIHNSGREYYAKASEDSILFFIPKKAYDELIAVSDK